MKSVDKPDAPPEKILLVDDVAANLSVLSAALEPEGYEILTTSNGVAALKIAAKAKPALILLDVLMPELDGLETCRRLKQNRAYSRLGQNPQQSKAPPLQ